MAQYRVLVSSGGKDEGMGGTWDGVKDAAKDPFTWLFCGMHFSFINAQSFEDFFPSISLPQQAARLLKIRISDKFDRFW